MLDLASGVPAACSAANGTSSMAAILITKVGCAVLLILLMDLSIADQQARPALRDDQGKIRSQRTARHCLDGRLPLLIEELDPVLGFRIDSAEGHADRRRVALRPPKGQHEPRAEIGPMDLIGQKPGGIGGTFGEGIEVAIEVFLIFLHLGDGLPGGLDRELAVEEGELHNSPAPEVLRIS